MDHLNDLDLDEFRERFVDAPETFRRKLRDYLLHPSERNACFVAGYVAALEDAHLFKTADASYWLTLIDRAENDDDLGYELIVEMDNPPAGDEVIFVDGVGAGRTSIKSCHNGVQWIRVGGRVYWPLSDSDAKRLLSACCGNGTTFDGPTTLLTLGK
jgi:hypothetical protein